MSNKTAIAVDRWVAERVREFREHDGVGMVFDGHGKPNEAEFAQHHDDGQ